MSIWGNYGDKKSLRLYLRDELRHWDEDYR